MLKFSTSLFLALMMNTALFATEALKESPLQRKPVPFKEELELTYQFMQSHQGNAPKVLASSLKALDVLVERENVDALNAKGMMLEDGSSGFKKDIPSAIELYKKAVAKGSAAAELNMGQLYAYERGYINFREAESLLLKALDHGERDALYALGAFYKRFSYVDKAIPYFEQAAKKRDGDAFFQLAQIYQYYKKDIPQAIYWYEEALKLKHWDAYARLGQVFQHDKGDIKKAIEYFEKGIAKGSDFALFLLTQLYDFGGPGFPSDPEKASELYKKAILSPFCFDVPHSLHALIPDKVEANFWLCCRDFKKNVKEFEELKDLFSTKDESLKKESLSRVKEIAAKGNFLACHVLGLYYKEPANPIQSDSQISVSTPYQTEHDDENAQMSFDWFTKAMELGSRPSILELGRIYERGLKQIAPNTEKAIELYTLLAKDIGPSSENCTWDAANALADYYVSLGDIESAFYWYKSSGTSNAYSNIASAFHFGSENVEKNIKKAIEWYEKGVEAQDQMSIERLAEIYREGRDGIEKNVEKALQLYLKGEEFGYSWYLERIGNIYFEGEGGVKKDLKKALFYYERAIQEPSCPNSDTVSKLISFYSGECGEEFEDYKKAVELYEEARTHQQIFIKSPWLTKAYKKLAQRKEKENILEAIKYYEKPANDDDQEACLRLSEIFEHGIGGIEKSPERAAYWREKIEHIKQEEEEYKSYMQQMRLREEEEKKKRDEAERKRKEELDQRYEMEHRERQAFWDSLLMQEQLSVEKILKTSVVVTESSKKWMSAHEKQQEISPTPPKVIVVDSAEKKEESAVNKKPSRLDAFLKAFDKREKQQEFSPTPPKVIVFDSTEKEEKSPASKKPSFLDIFKRSGGTN
jgi:hypothetical protein